MRIATILPRSSIEPVAVIEAKEGEWIELAGFVNRPIVRLEDALPWLMTHEANVRSRALAWRGPRYRPSEFEFLPPVIRPASFRDFYAYEQHAKAAGTAKGSSVPEAWYEQPAFYFSNHNGLVGHEASVSAPVGCNELDFELELGVVIGKNGKNVPVERAWDYVAGFTIINDLSARDLQRTEMSVGMGPAKGKDFGTAVGPWLTLKSAVADRIQGERLSLAMTARLNGVEISSGSTDSLYHSIPRMIAQASRDADIFCGDLIGTGTVGTGCILELGPQATGGWLKQGDVVELEIETLGTLKTTIGSRPAPTGTAVATLTRSEA